MRVGMVLKKFEPKTGKSRHLLEVSRRLASLGVDTILVTNRVVWDKYDPALNHLRIHELGGRDTLLYLKPAKLAALLEREQVNLVEIHGNLTAALVLPSFCSQCKKPVVFNIHSSPAPLSELANLKVGDFLFDLRHVFDVDELAAIVLQRRVLKWLLGRDKVRALILPSRKLEAEVASLLPNKRCYYIPSGVDVDRFSYVSEGAGRRDKDSTIFFFGRAIMVRGIDTLVNAFTVVKKYVPHAKLELALLPDRDIARVHRLIARSPLANSITYNIGYDWQIEQRLAKAALAAFPFRTSGCIPEQPLTLLEAMSCRKPVITTNVGSLSEIVKHKENGLVVEPNNEERLAEAIRELLQNPDLANQLANDARHTVVENFNWDKIAQDTLNVYRQVLNV